MTRIAAIGQAGVPPVNERELQAAVIELARSLGWGVTQSAAKRQAEEARQYGIEPPPLDGLIFHPRYSLGSEPGWPDLTLVRRRDRRLIFAELKTAKGVVSPRQAEVLELLRCLEPQPVEGHAKSAGDAQALALFVDAIRGVRIQVHVWRPTDLTSGAIADALR